MNNNNLDPSFHIVMPIGPNDIDIAALSIQYLRKYFSFEKLWVISNKNIFDKIPPDNKIVFINEDDLIPGITLQVVREYCKSIFNDVERGGWYFQQFLKMAVSLHPAIAPYYLVWDADTIPLKRISFFSPSGKILLSYKEEIHQPYFDTLQKILDIERQVDFSFITEHMMIDKTIMNEIIHHLDEETLPGNNWVEKILLAVNKNQYASGFSEFETYGNYLAKYYPGAFLIRKISIKEVAVKLPVSQDGYY